MCDLCACEEKNLKFVAKNNNGRKDIQKYLFKYMIFHHWAFFTLFYKSKTTNRFSQDFISRVEKGKRKERRMKHD